jgi:hypothetical protein
MALWRPVRTLSLALLLAWGAALAQPKVIVIERQSISSDELGVPEGTHHRLRLAIVILEGAAWTRERAMHALLQASPILGQCGVVLERVEFLVLEVPASYLDFSTPAARELARAYSVPRPAVYLVRDTKSRPAFEAEAIGRGNSATRPEIADTVWMTSGTRDPGVALAHELAHVLMDSGEHSDEAGNLMRDETSRENRKLSTAQCARLLDRGKANGLLN